ncbi:DUF488 domain-containing protein [Vreelandella sulfidaeris]
MVYHIELKRVYAPIDEQDGVRVLVDRLWPRGKTRSTLALDEWCREVAPSSELRRHYLQQKISQAVFNSRYRHELKSAPDNVLPLMRYAREGRLTLLTASRHIEKSHLPELKETTLAALAEEDASDSEPSSSPCYAQTLPTSLR